MSAPFVSRWGKVPSHAALTPDELSRSTFVQHPGASARTLATRTGVGVFSKPLSTLSKLDSTMQNDESVQQGSARKRIQAWEEKRVRFMEERNKNTAGAGPILPKTPEKSVEGEYGTQSYDNNGRSQAPSPSTPRGLQDAILGHNGTARPSTVPVLEQYTQKMSLSSNVSTEMNSLPQRPSSSSDMSPSRKPMAAFGDYPQTPTRFGKHMSSMYSDLDERRSERKKKLAYQQQLDMQIEERRKSNGAVSRRPKSYQNQSTPVHELPSTAPLGALASKRMSAEEYRAELDRQVEAKLSKLKAEAAMEVAELQQPFSTGKQVISRSDMGQFSDGVDAFPLPEDSTVRVEQFGQKPMSGSFLNTRGVSTQPAVSSAKNASIGTQEIMPGPHGSRPNTRLSPQRYKAELDAQVQAKKSHMAALSRGNNERGSKAVPTYETVEYALPMEDDIEAKRQLEKSRQKSYRLDLDALVQMRAMEKQAGAYPNKPTSSGGISAVSNKTTGNILSGLGNHHFHNTAAGLMTGGAPAFGRGLSSLHSGVSEPNTEELLLMKRRQYRLELEKQMEEKKMREASVPPSAPSYVTPQNFTSDYNPQGFAPRHPTAQADFKQVNPSSGIAGFSGLGQRHVGDHNSERNIRLGAHRHLEMESPEIRQEKIERRQYEARKKEIYANELRQQMEEREARRKAEKERIALEDERLSQKVQRDIIEEIKTAQTNNEGGNVASALPTNLVTADSSEPSRVYQSSEMHVTTSFSQDIKEELTGAEIPSMLSRGDSASSLGGLAQSGGSGTTQWKGFTRFKVKSLDPEEQDAILRKQQQQNETAYTLRRQIEERKRRREEAAKKREEEERAEEERIERERRELEERYAKQTLLEQAKRNKETTSSPGPVHNLPSSPKKSPVQPLVRSKSAPMEYSNASINYSQDGHIHEQHNSSPVASLHEQERFRHEMEMKQKELEAQLKHQKDLVSQMQATMAQAIEAQRAKQHQNVALMQQNESGRRQWALPPSMPQIEPAASDSLGSSKQHLTISPTRYSQEWAAQIVQEAETIDSGHPPLPIPSNYAQVAPRYPVDPAFVSRPKIANSLDEATMESILHSKSSKLTTVEQSLDSKSKLVDVMYEYDNFSSSKDSLAMMGKTWVAPENNTSWLASRMAPAPLPSVEPQLETTQLNAKQPDSRSPSIVEQSLASSSKLIFLKGETHAYATEEPRLIANNNEQRKQRDHQQQNGDGIVTKRQRTRPTTASIPSTIIEEPATGEDSVSSDSNTVESSISSPNKMALVSQKLGSPSNLPSMTWDENASPAGHPHKKRQSDSKDVTPHQTSRAEAQDSGRTISSDDSKPSPSMKVVADFLGVKPVIPSQISPPTSSPFNSPGATAELEASSPATPPRENLQQKFRVQTPTRKDREAMQQSMKRWEETQNRLESTESTPEINL